MSDMRKSKSPSDSASKTMRSPTVSYPMFASSPSCPMCRLLPERYRLRKRSAPEPRSYLFVMLGMMLPEKRVALARRTFPLKVEDPSTMSAPEVVSRSCACSMRPDMVPTTSRAILLSMEADAVPPTLISRPPVIVSPCTITYRSSAPACTKPPPAPSLLSVLQLKLPVLSVFSTLPDAEPSLLGNVYVTPPIVMVLLNVAAPSTISAPEDVMRSSACKVPPEMVAKFREEPVRDPLRVKTVPFRASPWPATYVVPLSWSVAQLNCPVVTSHTTLLVELSQS